MYMHAVDICTHKTKYGHVYDNSTYDIFSYSILHMHIIVIRVIACFTCVESSCAGPAGQVGHTSKD